MRDRDGAALPEGVEDIEEEPVEAVQGERPDMLVRSGRTSGGEALLEPMYPVANSRPLFGCGGQTSKEFRSL